MYISQCIIAKNEEENIEYCLSHLKTVVDEQIVVDTGSTDRTVEIAEKLGAKIFHFDWINDFSAARNFAIEKAKGEWIIFLDCDEYFTDDSTIHILEAIKMGSKRKDVDGIICEMFNVDNKKNILSTVKGISPRIFKNKKNIRYKNRIHEVLYNGINIKGKCVMRCLDESNNIKIMHTGYDSETVKEKDKNKRNLDLLKEELKKNPEDSITNFYLSKSLYMDNQYEEALLFAYKALEHKTISNEAMNPTIYGHLLGCMVSLKKPLEEIIDVYEMSINEYPDFPDYYGYMGIKYLNSSNVNLAIKNLEKCIELCKSYKMSTESVMIGQIEKIYTDLLTAYILDDNKPKIVEIVVALLNVDKYNYSNLTILLKTLLTEEKVESIILFLNKLYSYNNFKDKIYLIKASETAQCLDLANYYKSLLTPEENSAYEHQS